MAQRAINLTFHGIGPTDRRLDLGEDAVWLDRDRFEAVLDSVAGNTDVRITFDDGNRSDLLYALPALTRRGVTATFFVVAGRMGTPGFLDEDDMRALAAAGMEIGCHGMRHRAWRRLDQRTLAEELVDARRMLEAVVARPVTKAACPFGSYDRSVLRSLRRCGYRHVYTSDCGTAHSGDWLQARNTVRAADDLALVEQVHSLETPIYNAVRRRMRLAAKRWR
jgi:peptidoglycan/xylan/chitin deacetylase (PgdA/CDA1 family)